MGAEPAVLVPVSRLDQYAYRRTHEKEFADVPLYAFDDAFEHPDLYDSRLWGDRQHLTPAGSVLFSRKLGAAIVAQQRRRPPRAGP
jgi:hypothetical protein